MDAAEHNILRKMEDDHWWYRTLRWQVLRQLPKGITVLDAGCGTGGLMRELHGVGNDVHGVDLSPAAIDHCRQRGLANIQVASVHALPFSDGSFDAVVSLDVLYHRDVEDGRALAEMKRVLKPGGILILNLPAFDCLRGAHDTAVCGARRYTRCQVQSLLNFHNLKSEMTHYWNAWLFLPILGWRQLSRRIAPRTTSDLGLHPGVANGALSLIGKLDAMASKCLRLPFGTSLFVVARHSGHE